MLKRTLLAGLTLAAASVALLQPANAHRFGPYPHGPWSHHGPAHALAYGGGYVAHLGWHRARWAAAPARFARPRYAAQPAPASPAGGGMVGRASFYSGGRTASGGMVGAATCAHRSLPFGTRILVTNLSNAHQMVLTVNDRGPFSGGRIVDVSRPAAAVLGMLQSGVATIRMVVIGGPA